MHTYLWINLRVITNIITVLVSNISDYLKLRLIQYIGKGEKTQSKMCAQYGFPTSGNRRTSVIKNGMQPKNKKKYW